MIVLFSKIFALTLAVMVIVKSVLDYKSRNESLTMTVFWIIAWLAIATVALYPALIDKAINQLGGGKTGLGTIFGMGLIFLVYICYRVYTKCQRLENQLGQIASKLALKDIRGKK